MENTPRISVDTFLPVVETFFRKITPEQCELLKAGKPDHATKVIIAQLLLEVVSILESTAVSQEGVSTSVGDTLPQTFARALSVEREVHTASSQKLTELIDNEVAESVNSVISTKISNVEPVISPHVTAPRRLNNMVSHACKMLKELMVMMRAGCVPTPQKNKSEVEDEDDLEDRSSKGSAKDRDSLVASTSKTVQEIITKEIREITDSLLDGISDYDYQQLESSSSVEIKNVGDDIAQVIVDEILEERDAVGTPEHKSSLKKVGTKIRTFVAKQFAQASIFNIITELKKKFCHGSKAPSRQSMQSLKADVDSLLETDIFEPRWTEEICAGKVEEFTEELSDILNNYVDEMRPRLTPEPNGMGSSAVVVSSPRKVISTDINSRVRRFLGLMRWWLKTQADTHSDKVTSLTVAETQSEEPTQLPEITVVETSEPFAAAPVSDSVYQEIRARCEEEQRAETEKNKMSVQIIVEKLVSRLFRKAKMNCASRAPDTIIRCLFEKIWAELEGDDFVVTLEMLKDLDKIIFSSLCENWRCAEIALIEIDLEFPVIEKFVAFSFKQHLTTPPKKCRAIRRFFSRVGKAFTRPFRK